MNIISNTLTWKPHCLSRKFTGDVTGEEILKSNFDLQAHPRFAAIKYIVNDFTEVANLLIDTDHTKIYASTDDIISDTKGKFKIAMVVNQEAHVDLAKSYRDSLKNNVYDCEIFETVKDAKKWGEL